MHAPSKSADDNDDIQGPPKGIIDDDDKEEDLKYEDPSVILDLDLCQKEELRQRHRKPVGHDAWSKRFGRDEAYQYPPLQSKQAYMPLSRHQESFSQLVS